MKNYVKYPIIPIAFFYVNGIFFSDQISNFVSEKIVWSFLITSLCVSVFLHFQKNKISHFQKGNTIIISFIFFIIGILSFQKAKIENQFETPEYHIGIVTINEVLKSNTFQNRYYADFTSVNGIEQKILIYQNVKDTKLNVGTRLEMPLYIEAISKPKNPYQFDYASYLANKQILIQAKLPDAFTVLKPAESIHFKLLYFREKLMKSFQVHHFSTEVNGVVNALLFGQRADLSEKIQADYRNAGVMHILAISGMHIGILYWMMNLVLSTFIRSKNVRFITVIMLLSCFAIITGLSGSVVRAVLMFAIVGSAMMFKRKTSTFNVLALSMLFILLINPFFLFDVGFQLSYLAVFSIVYLYPVIRPYFQTKFKILNYFLEIVGISIVAQIGILPLTVYYFGQIPLLFLFGNLVVIPILTFVLIGLVVLLILNFVWINLSVFLGKFIAILIDFVNGVIAFIASKTSFVLTDIKLSLFQCLLYLGIVFLSAFILKGIKFRKVIALLFLIVALQLSYFFENIKMQSANQLKLFYDYESVVLARMKNREMFVLSSDSLVQTKKYLASFSKAFKVKKTEFIPINNYFKIDDLKFLLVDSLAVTELPIAIDVLILKDNPKFNLDRYLQKHQPKLIVFHPKNFRSNVERWEETCVQKKIPFHNMHEKGFVDLGFIY